MSHWLETERQAIQDQDFFRMGIDERRKFDDWERNKERAGELVDELIGAEDDVERARR